MCFKGIVYESFLIKVDFAVCIRLRKKRFFIFYGGKVKLPAFFNTQKAQLPL